MTPHFFRKIFIFLSLVSFSSFQAYFWQSTGAAKGANHISHFMKVTDYYYRGGQPDSDSVKFLAASGVKTIIDLRGSDNSRATEERTEAQSVGIKYISLPLSSVHAPSDEQVAQFLTIVHDKKNQPVYVHCRRGSDRTGVMTAAMRIHDFGWTADQAYEEMKEYGFRPMLEPGMKHYIFQYAGKKTN
jgi:protein tyrosine/serine phosphatase